MDLRAVDTAHVASLVVPSRYGGPPGSVNGGWIAGHLAGLLPDADLVEVTLRAPTPLDHRLSILHTGSSVVLADGEQILVTAGRSTADATPTAPPFIDPVTAELSSFDFRGFDWHPFPTCFVCGNDRHAGDGLRVFPGPVAGHAGTVATLWTAPGDGAVAAEVVWGLLDCPTGWAHMSVGGVCLLGRITAARYADIVGGESYVVIAAAGGRDGRKLPASGAIYTTDGALVAASDTVWIDVTGR